MRNCDIESEITSGLNADVAEGLSTFPASPRKRFVEPAISVPADVLEATAFFQVPTASSGDSDCSDTPCVP